MLPAVEAPADVLVAGRSAIATITQSVLVAVVYVSVIVPDWKKKGRVHLFDTVPAPVPLSVQRKKSAT